MHVDPIAARRLIAGDQVVHGVHILITGIEYWQNDNDLLPVSISCSFDNPVSIGDNVTFTQRSRREHDFVVEAVVRGLVCSRIVITAAPKMDQNRLGAAASGNKCNSDEVMIDRLSGPLDEAPGYHRNKVYLVRLSEADLSKQFPRLYRYFGKRRIAAILALSYFVGMVCPGLHSIFSTVDLTLTEDTQANHRLAFRVDEYDERFRLFDISVTGCIYGRIKAFLRPAPQTQPSLKDLAGHIHPKTFSGTRSLVVGGSRGLGEITAKLVAAGGGDVVITYASGVDDARNVSDEINESGLGHCETLKLDLTSDSFESMSVGVDSLDTVYFFATPRIYRKKAALFDPQLFREFADFYIEKFYAMCVYLESRVVTRKIRIYFPSSVFVSERPNGMTEYSMAKSAAEVLVEDLNRYFRKLSVVTTRLPRLNTDQTSSLLKLPTESNVEALLPIIKSMAK